MPTTTATAPTADAAADRFMQRVLRLYEEPAHRRLLLLAGLIEITELYAEDWLREHPAACPCGFCGRRLAIRRDIAGVAWACEAAGVIQSELVNVGEAVTEGEKYDSYTDWLKA